MPPKNCHTAMADCKVFPYTIGRFLIQKLLVDKSTDSCPDQNRRKKKRGKIQIIQLEIGPQPMPELPSPGVGIDIRPKVACVRCNICGLNTHLKLGITLGQQSDFWWVSLVSVPPQARTIGLPHPVQSWLLDSATQQLTGSQRVA